jgi:hypothetical protein
MSYHIFDFNNKDIIEPQYNFDNIIIGKRIKIDVDNNIYYIYYNDPDLVSAPKEIYIRLPKIRLIYNMANHKYNQLKIPIYPNWEQSENFIQFIKTVETDIYSCFQEKKINKEFCSLLSKKNGFAFIKTKLGDQYKITSNLDKQVTLNDFKINGEIEMVIKISFIWSNAEKIGLSSQLYQIKYYGPPEQLEIDFIDINPPTKPINKIPPVIPTPPILPPPTVMNDTFPQIKLKMIPSVKDLQNAIKLLKPANKENS